MKRKNIETAPMDGTTILVICQSHNGNEYYKLVSYRHDDNDPVNFHGSEGESWGKMWLDDSYDDFSCGLASCSYNPVAWIELPELNK